MQSAIEKAVREQQMVDDESIWETYKRVDKLLGGEIVSEMLFGIVKASGFTSELSLPTGTVYGMFTYDATRLIIYYSTTHVSGGGWIVSRADLLAASFCQTRAEVLRAIVQLTERVY